MDLTLSSRIKAIFTKVFCTFFTPLPRIRAICRPTGALLRSTRFRHGSIPKRPLIPTFLSNDNEVERRFAERARNQIAPPPGFSIELRYFNSKLQMEAQRHGKQTRYASFFLLPFSFNFHLYFKNSVQSSISFHLYSSFLFILFFPSFRICQRFRPIDITPCLYVSFSHLSLFISISPLFESLFSTRSIPIVNVPISLVLSSIFVLSFSFFSSISLLQRFLSNNRHRFFLFLISFFYLFLSFLLKIPSNDIVFSVSLFFSSLSFFSFCFFPFFFIQSSIAQNYLSFCLYLSFPFLVSHLFIPTLSFLHDRSTLKIHVYPRAKFLPLPFRG